MFKSGNQTLMFMYKSQAFMLNAVNDVMDKASDTFDAVLWSGKETRKMVVNTAITTGHFTRELSKNIFQISMFILFLVSY